MLTQIQPPEPLGTTVVSLAEAKAHLRVESTDENVMIERLLKTAQGALEAPDGLLSQAFLTQTWKLTLDRFASAILLPFGPVQSISGVTTPGANGGSTTIAPEIYRLDDRTLRLIDGQTWPTPIRNYDAAEITFVAGYGDAEAVPEPIKSAILAHVSLLYESREGLMATTMQIAPGASADLVRQFREFGF